MIWAFPAAAWFGLALIPAVVVFFYRKRAREVTIPAVREWLLLGDPVEVHAWKNWLRRILALLLQLLIMLLLILALADPGHGRSARRLVLVLDLGSTMQTREQVGTRFDGAVARARRLAAAVPRDGEVVILAAAHATMLKLRPNRRGEADAVLAGLTPVDVDSDVPAAVRAAQGYVDPKTITDVVVLSDFSGGNIEAIRGTWTGPGRLRLVQVGSEQPNVALTALWSEPAGVQRRFVMQLQHKGLRDRIVPVHLLVNGRPLATRTVRLGDEPAFVTLEAPAAGGSSYEAVLDAAALGDTYGLDDHAYGVVPQRDRLSILLVTAGNHALELALRAEPAASLRVVPPASYRGPEGANVVVVDDATIPAGAEAAGMLFIHAMRAGSGVVLSTDQPVRPVTHWLGDHPVMADLDPTLLEITHAATVPATTARSTILSADKAPLIIEAPASSGERQIYWLFRAADGPLIRRLSFPLLLWNSIDYVARIAQRAPETGLTGRPLRIPGTLEPKITSPRGMSVASRRSTDGWVVPDTLVQGHYTRDSGEVYGVSLLSTRGVQPLPRVSDAEEKARPAAAVLDIQRWVTRGNLLLLAALVMLLDWLLFHRGWIRIG